MKGSKKEQDMPLSDVISAFVELVQNLTLVVSAKSHTKGKQAMSTHAMQIAIFGGGCFWCTEPIFSRLKGVGAVLPGYAGGTTTNPTYDQVCSGSTGHAEVASIEFDSSVISYEQLVDVFMHTHNPTTLNQQGNDRGTQYRSIILTTSTNQQTQAEQVVNTLKEDHVFTNPIITEIKPLVAFYPAEDYHQRYYEKNQDAPYCQVIINPKLAKFRKSYATLIKE
jgi:peptide-methionine (S)-S-oxide reductase